MGDVGSGLLGFVFGTLAIASENAGGLPVLGWMMLLGVFVVDATATLVRRALKGERIYEAHRTHAYQLLAARQRNHRSVTTGILALTLALAVVTWVTWRWPTVLLVVFALVMGGLLLVWWRVVSHLLPTDESTLQSKGARVRAR